jgi:hypothetical protein
MEGLWPVVSKIPEQMHNAILLTVSCALFLFSTLLASRHHGGKTRSTPAATNGAFLKGGYQLLTPFTHCWPNDQTMQVLQDKINANVAIETGKDDFCLPG